MTNRAHELFKLGQSLWYDNIQRRLLENGEMAGMIERGEIRGVTSNPSIFEHAIAKSNDYDDDLLPLLKQGKTGTEIFEELAFDDIMTTADLFRPLYDSSLGGDGYVSLEVNPNLARDTKTTMREAQRLWERVNRPNLMVKIPATSEGIPAIEKSIADGLNINITLIFSRQRYAEVMEAYLSALEARAQRGEPLDCIASVASFFVSRIDTKIDGWLEGIIKQEGPNAALAAKLKGKAAIANAKLAYRLFRETFGSERFAKLKAKGARVQRPLWASTSTKNPSYPDLLYVDGLIGADTVNTVPPQTLAAFLDHGSVKPTLELNLDETQQVLADLDKVGISLDQATQELEEEGVAAFSKAFNDLVAAIEARRNA